MVFTVNRQARHTALADSCCHFDLLQLGNRHKQLSRVTHHRFHCCVATLQALLLSSLLFGLSLGLIGLFGASSSQFLLSFALEFCFESRIQCIHFASSGVGPILLSLCHTSHFQGVNLRLFLLVKAFIALSLRSVSQLLKARPIHCWYHTGANFPAGGVIFPVAPCARFISAFRADRGNVQLRVLRFTAEPGCASFS